MRLSLGKGHLRICGMACFCYFCNKQQETTLHSLQENHPNIRTMKRTALLLLTCLVQATLHAEDGHDLWLRFPAAGNVSVSCQTSVQGQPQTGETATIEIAADELRQHLQGREATLRLLPGGKTDGSFDISSDGEGHFTLQSGSAVGLLYGAYHLLRQQQTGGTLTAHEVPFFPLRLLNHWDNPDGSVERGYAGKSIWRWEEIDTLGTMSEWMEHHLRQYARANASIGINGTVLNNVNAKPEMLTRAYIKKVAVIAHRLRPYGIKVYLSINFASPMALGYTTTADPLNEDVRQWWTDKVKEIYSLIPDFGGLLVKANSEGQPGPGDYHRTHADGANMLADALQPYGGIVMWRSFVYGANHKGEDRVKQAVSEFKPMDGLFRDNVILQSKNGPLDFQPREPYAPIFDQIKQTTQMAELQITQEYLGQSRHLVYLAPMWKEFFGFVSPSMLKGIAGVANIGDDANWCGHPFSQANWYAFGRLAWNPALGSDEIAEEWLKQTFSTDEHFVTAITRVMGTSREACVDYMMPLGLHHIFRFDHHYGPEPDGFKAEYPIEWCPVYYHKGDAQGIGFDRTSATGSDATAQYRQPYRGLYDQVRTCPEEYLLWFHHVPWTYKMKNGKTLWKNLRIHYRQGVNEVKGYSKTWKKMRRYVDEDRWQHVDRLLQEQYENASEWRDVCIGYFGHLRYRR